MFSSSLGIIQGGLALSWIFCIVVCHEIAKKKGFKYGWFYGFALSYVGVFYLYVRPSKKATENTQQHVE